MPKMLSNNRVHLRAYDRWKIDLHPGPLRNGRPYYWDPWGYLPSDQTRIVTHLTARVIAGDRDALRIPAADIVVEICHGPDPLWRRHLEHILRTPLEEELEQRLVRMEVVLNWIMSAETEHAKTLARLGAKPLKDVPRVLTPGQFPKPILIQPRTSLNIGLVLEKDVEISMPATICFELQSIHSRDTF